MADKPLIRSACERLAMMHQTRCPEPACTNLSTVNAVPPSDASLSP